MAVYINDNERFLGTVLLVDMYADTSKELMTMIKKINLNKSYLVDASLVTEHIPISRSFMRKALELGAIKVTKQETLALVSNKLLKLNQIEHVKLQRKFNKQKQSLKKLSQLRDAYEKETGKTWWHEVRYEADPEDGWGVGSTEKEETKQFREWLIEKAYKGLKHNG